MGTIELLIVFSALMVLIALVSIGIDWIGKPLRHRRFIPRLYRFDDEKLPVDSYGNTTFGPAAAPLAPMPGPMQAPTPAGMPMANQAMPNQAMPNQAMPNQARPVVVADLGATHLPDPAQTVLTASVAAAPGVGSSPGHSAFSDSLASSAPEHDSPRPGGPIAAPDPAPAPAQSWQPGMALDTTVDDRKPNLATKAERYWKTKAGDDSPTHFDDHDRERMTEGKAPRRANPRTGRTETMQLSGLRQASYADEVRMTWPADSVDPWNPR